MKKLILVTLIFALCAPAFADEDLLKAHDEDIQTTVGVYLPHSSGNQSWVRQYDGRGFPAIGLEGLDAIGYDGPFQYFVRANDVTQSDADATAILRYKNLYSMSWETIGLTQRFARIPAVNPALIGTPASGTTPGQGDFRVDLSPNGEYFMDRRANDFKASLTPWSDSRARFVIGLWQVDEDGSKQLQFRSRQAQAGVIANGTKGLVAIPFDRNTNQATMGGDFALGNNSVLNYRFENTKFSGGGFQTAGTSDNFLPLNSLTQVDSDTTSHIWKMRSTLGPRLYFTGVQIHRNRVDDASSVSVPFGARAVEINSTNLALNYLATDSLTFTGRYRTYILDNTRTDTAQDSDAISSRMRSVEFGTSFTGIRHAFLNGGYERRETDRTDPIEPAEVGAEFPILNDHTRMNYYRAGLRYYPLTQLSIVGNVEWMNGDVSPFAGTPDRSSKYNVNATYMVRSNAAIYGDFNKQNQRNTQIRADLASLTTSDLRQLAAGQGYGTLLQNSTLGAWYSVNQKLTLDVSYSKIVMDAEATWIFGTAAPELTPFTAPFKSNDNQLGFGGNYSINSKNRVNAHAFYSKSQGEEMVNTSIVPVGIGPVWNPFDAWDLRWSFGFAHDLTSKDTLQVDFSIEQWHDRINAANSGLFNLTRLAWMHSF